MFKNQLNGFSSHFCNEGFCVFEIASAPNTQGRQEEANREALRCVLFLDAGVESIQFGFVLVASSHFLPVASPE